MIKGKWMILILVLLIVPNLAFSGIKCLYVSTLSGEAPYVCDPIVNHMTDWGYEMTYINTDECVLLTLEDYANYDLVFIDEIVGSASLEPIDLLEGHPIPLVTTENYAPRLNILAYRGSDDATNIPAEQVEIVADGHPMCAGFNLGEKISIHDGIGANDLITNEPTIDAVIPIAASTADKNRIIIFGVEAEGETLSGVPIVNRAGVVGFHADGYAGINENGWIMFKAAFDWVLEGTDVDETGAASPETYRLAQNYPNPFNPITTIAFQLEKPGYTTLSVYNANGQLISTLIDGNMSSGSHQVRFDGGDNPSGVYFCKIQSGDFTQSQKMLLVK